VEFSFPLPPLLWRSLLYSSEKDFLLSIESVENFSFRPSAHLDFLRRQRSDPLLVRTFATACTWLYKKASGRNCKALLFALISAVPDDSPSPRSCFCTYFRTRRSTIFNQDLRQEALIREACLRHPALQIYSTILITASHGLAFEVWSARWST